MAENDIHFSRRVPRNRSLRAADRDRDAVGAILRREHVAGRLDTDEFADRFGRCLEAKTYAQLDELIADLPLAEELDAAAGGGLRGGAGRPWLQTAGGTGGGRGPSWLARYRWRAALLLWLGIAAGLAMLSGGRLFWLGFPLFFFFIIKPLGCRPRWRSSRHWDGWHQGGAWGSQA